MPSEIQSAARVLTSSDNTYSDYEKALRLFQLQAWIFAPTPEIRRAARRLVIVKMLEHLQEQICPDRPSLKALAADKHYRGMFDEFLTAGGWKKLRHTMDVKIFDEEHQKAVVDCSAASQVIDFSIRYDPSTGSPRHNGGSTMARSIILKSCYYNIGMRRTKLKSIWVKYEHSAPFIYLFRLQGFSEIKPYRVSKTNFASKLITTAKKATEWRELFLAYNAVVSALEPRDYSYKTVECNPGEGQANLKTDPLPNEILQLIKDYKPGD